MYILSMKKNKKLIKKSSNNSLSLFFKNIYFLIDILLKTFYYLIFSMKLRSSSLHFPLVLLTNRAFEKGIHVSSSFCLNTFRFLLRSFWFILSIFVNTIENGICSSMRVVPIFISISCGGMLISINKKRCLRVSLDVKKVCEVSIHLLFSWSFAFAYPYHGRSTSCRLLLMRKKLINFVFHGILEDFAKFFLFVKKLISEDFPTFDLQKNANSGYEVLGHWLKVAALVINSADVMFIEL